MSSLLGLGGNKAQKQVNYSGLNVSTSKRDMPIPIPWGQRAVSTNCIWYNDFQKHKQSAKGKGGGGKGGQYTYSAAVALALGEGVIDSIGIVWSSGSTTTTTTLAALGFTFYSGTASQAPEPWIVSHYPSEAESYAYTSYLFNPKLDLGSSAQVPDNTFEVIRLNGFSYSKTNPGWINPETHAQGTAIDVLMADVMVDWLTNPQYGMGFATGDFDSYGLSQYQTYGRAQGLVFSPLLNEQETGTQVVDRWAMESNTWIYFDGTKFRFVPLGDSTITANGVTYTPDIDVAYQLTNADFKDLKITRKDPVDCYNRTILNFTDRTLGYISNPAEYIDDDLIATYGLRDNSAVQATDICDPTVATMVAQLVGKRAAYIRNTIQFKASYRFIRCLPGTIIGITDPNIGLNQMTFRVTKVEEEDDGNLSFEAEEFTGQTGTFTSAVTAPTVTPTYPNFYQDPGSVNTPGILEPDSTFTGGVPRLLIAASGGASWGGGVVNISFDGLSYNPIGEITDAAIQGLLTAILPSHADPDTVDTLSVDATQSLGIPQPVTHDDADQFRTLFCVAAQPIGGLLPNDGEYGTFGDTATTGTYSADLTYLRRALYGTSAASHAIGQQWTLFDITLSTGSTISYDLPPQYIGQTIYLKIQSKNIFTNVLQDLSLCTEYTYVPTGRGYGGAAGGVPLTPTGLAVGAGVSSANVDWAANAATDNVTSYKLYRAAGTGGFGVATLVWEGLALARTDPGLTPGAQYTYYLTAVNAVGESSNTAGVTVTVASTQVNQFGFAFDRDTQFGTLGSDFVEFVVNFDWNITAGVPQGYVKTTGTGPTVQTDWDLQVNGASIGSIRFAISATTATFVGVSSTPVPAGQVTKIVKPANLNGMTGRLFGSIVGTK